MFMQLQYFTQNDCSYAQRFPFPYRHNTNVIN